MTGFRLEDLDGVGTTRARKLQDAGFETVESLLRATMADLTTIDGIGEATATDILASSTALLDASEPTVETTPSIDVPESYTFYEPVLAEPYRPVLADDVIRAGDEGGTTGSTAPDDAVATDETERSADSPRPGDGGWTHTTPSVADGVAVEVAAELLAAEADADGRIGRERLDASDVDANVTLGVLADGDAEYDAEAVLETRGVDAADRKQLLKSADALRSWIETDPDRASRLVADRTGAITAALADTDLDASAVAGLIEPDRDGGLSPIGIGSLRVTLAGGEF